MICRFRLGLIARSVLRFLDRSLSRTMGCFIGCFGNRGYSRRTKSISSTSASSKSTAPAVSRNRLSSLFLDEEKGEPQSLERGNVGLESPHLGKALKDEAEFLKACGTIPETPEEIRKASEKLKYSPSYHAESESEIICLLVTGLLHRRRKWLVSGEYRPLQLELTLGELIRAASFLQGYLQRY